MSDLVLKNVPDYIIKKYGYQVEFSSGIFNLSDFDIDFKKEKVSNLDEDILNSINETKKIDKKNLICLSNEYADA